MFYDSHVHFDELDGERGVDATIARATAAGVGHLLAVGGDPITNDLACVAASRHPSVVGLAIGLDRDQTAVIREHGGDVGSAVSELGIRAESVGSVAIGEIGLDYHYSPETAEFQLALLRAQLALARDLKLPVIVHSRNAEEDTIRELREHVSCWDGADDRIGVLHCFTGDSSFAVQLREIGMYVSFSGIATFANASSIREAAELVPDHLLLIETDSPYLAPVPLRGQRNEPAYIEHVASVVAQVRGVSVEGIADLTSRNAMRLFDGQG